MPLGNSVALQLLSAYSSEEDSSETESEEAKVPTKKICTRLPLPKEFHKREEVIDDEDEETEKHEGRKRSFPHERGNWATYVYIPYETSSGFEVLCDSVISFYEPNVKLKRVFEPHISLTKTFVLLHHWIDHLMNTLKDRLKIFPSFCLELDTVSVYCNEEKTRTFIGFDVNFGKTELDSSITILENCLKEYKLSPFYTDPSFHMSVVWCLGDKKSELEEKLSGVRGLLEEYGKSNVGALSINVESYCCKTGHREYKFNLAPT